MSDARPGLPCWYELGTTDTDAAAAFYPDILDWTIVDSQVPGFDYRVFNDADGHGVAGLMSIGGHEGVPPHWKFYVEVVDCDAHAATITDAGGAVVVEPTDIPGTGRFAICTDPQGAIFGILEPAPMDEPAPPVRAFDQALVGHGNWHELSTTEPGAALEFYGRVFGWSAGEAMDMGEMGTYQIFRLDGQDLGGISPLAGAPAPAWLCYFGVAKTRERFDAVTAAGGGVLYEPMEVPGGAWAAGVADPQGAVFGIVGSEL